MTSDDRDSEANLLDVEAHRWITQLVSGEATVADSEALKQWCARSPQHQAAFAEAARRWKDIGAAGRELIEQGLLDTRIATSPRVDRRLVLGGAGALAAAAACYAVVHPPLGLWPSLRELAADYRTSTGEQRQVKLADTLSVELNTQTSISVPITGGETQVTLISGEAAFTTLASDRSLLVFAGNGRTVAQQARFSVRNVGPAVSVTCVAGEITVEQGTQSAMLGASRQLRYDGNGLGQAINVDPDEATSWQNGVLIFRYTPLSEVVSEINRYRPGRVILLNRALGPRLVNGRFRIQRIDEVLAWIEQAFGATARALPGGILLLS
jgi:transmembrane sensor